MSYHDLQNAADLEYDRVAVRELKDRTMRMRRRIKDTRRKRHNPIILCDRTMREHFYRRTRLGV